MIRRAVRPLMVTLMAALLGALVACGGGGSEGGIGGSGAKADSVSYGGITGFGSVWVNGVEYGTGSATVRLDGQSSSESALRVGMVVQVEGSITQRRADRLTVDESVEGVVDEVIDATRIVVMGQQIQFDAQTRFEGGVRPARGDWVDVHGLVVGDGIVAAGYVERKPAPAAAGFSVKGLVREHDPAARTFVIGALRVGYALAVVGDMPAGSWDGQLVGVRGTQCTVTAQSACGRLDASRVEPAGVRVASGLAAEVEGFVSAVDATGFTLGTQRVQVSTSTVYENGSVLDLVQGAKLEAEGPVVDGTLMARKISFRESLRVEADVLAVDGNAVSLVGLPGVPVRTDALTRYKGGLLSLSGLAPGYHVRVRGRPAVDGSVLAHEIELRSTTPIERIELRGPVSAVAAPTFTVLGVLVDTTALADADFRDLLDQPIGRAAFFQGLAAGDPVKARGRWRDGSLQWVEVGRED